MPRKPPDNTVKTIKELVRTTDQYPTDEVRRQLSEAGYKWCTGCKAWEPKDGFGANRSRADGLQPICREARAALYDRHGHRVG